MRQYVGGGVDRRQVQEFETRVALLELRGEGVAQRFGFEVVADGGQVRAVHLEGADGDEHDRLVARDGVDLGTRHPMPFPPDGIGRRAHACPAAGPR